jgi:phosphate transport system permease protein
MKAMENQIPPQKKLHADWLFQHVTQWLGVGLILLIIAILITLVWASWPSIHTFGWHFLWSAQWDPAHDQFGGLVAIIGTLITAIIGVIIAVPLSFGIAVLIVEILPPKIGLVVARLVELMAGIPSIIYGMWGLFTLAPFLAKHVQPWLILHCQHIPVLNYIFGGMPIGFGVFTAGIILAIMIIPLISSVMRDVLASVPNLLREAAYGVGATRWEVVWKILLHYTRAGLLGGVILGLGRALGETMAVTFVVGNSHQLFASLFMPGTTISATIANEFSEATGKLYPAALMELGLILFVITFVVLALSRSLLKRGKARGGSQ